MKTSAIRKKNSLGFTLIELLVAIGIIGFMAGMITYALLGAQTDARVARARSTIQKLNEVILQQWEEYRYRPVDVRKDDLEFAAGSKYIGKIVNRDLTRLRMITLRDSMRMELPDRINDVIFTPTQYNAIGFFRQANGQPFYSGVKVARAIPSKFGMLYNVLQNTVVSLQIQEQGSPFNFVDPNQKEWKNFSLQNIDLFDGVLRPFEPVTGLWVEPGSPPPGWEGGLVEWNRSVQSSEILYLLVSVSNFGGANAIELFRPSDIGDPDGDGLLEFIDAWGKPIQWIRWPAGFNSDLVTQAEPDAMDPQKTDWRFRASVNSDLHPKTLVPLIVSAGPDEEFGIEFSLKSGTNYASMIWPQNPDPPFGTDGSLHYAGNILPYYYPDPFATEGNALPNGSNQVGAVFGDLWVDNVTNHDLILEP